MISFDGNDDLIVDSFDFLELIKKSWIGCENSLVITILVFRFVVIVNLFLF
jgi:hypothetical protein